MKLKSSHPPAIAFFAFWTASFALSWTILNAMFSIFVGLGSPVGYAFDNPHWREIAMAIPIAAVQALALTPWMSRAWLWMAATAPGWMVGWSAVLVADSGLWITNVFMNFFRDAPRSGPESLPWWAASLLVGLVLGGSQFVALRSISRSAWLWIPANGIILALVRGILRSIDFQIALGDLLPNLPPPAWAPSLSPIYVETLAVTAAIEGLAIASLTGSIFLLLLRNFKPASAAAASRIRGA